MRVKLYQSTPSCSLQHAILMYEANPDSEQSTLALAEAYKDEVHRFGEFSFSEHELIYTLAVIRFSSKTRWR